MSDKNTIITIDLGGVNSYLLTVDNGFVLVDTGGHLTMDKIFDNRRSKLLEALKESGCTKDNLRLILLTHGDNDHTSSAAFLRTHFDAPIALHPEDLPLVANPTTSLWMKSFQYHSPVYKLVFKLLKGKITRLTQKTLEEFEPFQPDLLLSNGMRLVEYGIDGEILHLPGHTYGSIGLLLSNGSLIAGDTLANNGKPSAAVNALDFNKMYKSIETLRSKSIQKVFPGHGNPFHFNELK